MRDTLRIVEFVLRGADVGSAAVVGDFNAWQSGATALHRDADGAWRARVLVPQDVVRFAYEVKPTGDRPPHVVRARIDSI
jgi:hypothetical protein